MNKKYDSVGSEYNLTDGINVKYIDNKYFENTIYYFQEKYIVNIYSTYTGKLIYDNKLNQIFIDSGTVGIGLYGNFIPSEDFRGMIISINLELFKEKREKDQLILSLYEMLIALYEQGEIVVKNPEIEKIMREIYMPHKNIENEYQQIKLMELILFLSVYKEENQKSCSQNQIILAKEVCEFLLSNMEKHYTIENLSKIFHVSQTQLKNSFKRVYGEPIYSYIRIRKMKTAAGLIEENAYNITELAGLFGYDNGSKFAKAFKEVNGYTPRDYRKKMILKSIDECLISS